MRTCQLSTKRFGRNLAADGPAHGSTVTDIDVHGWLRVRFENAGASDLAAVAAALGLPLVSPSGTPALRVRYTDQVQAPDRGWSLGAGEAAFDDENFVLTRGRWGRPVAMNLPLPGLTGDCIDIVCEHGIGRPPLLTHLLNVAAVRAGGLALHASAFEHEGHGVLVLGWSKGGKTELLLGAVARGARYVADEWAYVPPNGRAVGGLGEPVRVWDWHLTSLPEYRHRLEPQDRARLRTFGTAVRALEGVSTRIGSRGDALRRALVMLERQRHVDVRPGPLFDAPEGPGRGPLDTVVLATVGRGSAIRAYEVDAEDVVLRAAASLAHERAPLAEALNMARFAFPSRPWVSLEELNAVETDRLRAVLSTKRVIRVEHPYPVPIEASTDALLEALH